MENIIMLVDAHSRLIYLPLYLQDLATDLEGIVQAIEFRYYRKLQTISCKDHVANEKSIIKLGVCDDFLTNMKSRKQMVWPYHKSSGNESTTILETVTWRNENKVKTGHGIQRLRTVDRHCYIVIGDADSLVWIKGATIASSGLRLG